MIALSTSFASGRFTDGSLLLAALERLGITTIELEYRLSGQVFQQMKSLLMRSAPKVASIHNFFPIPEVIKSGTGGGDLFLLSHPDREERLNAIKWTRRTIEHAHELEAGVVVLHCGRVKIEPAIEKWHDYYRSDQIDSEKAQTFISKALAYRDHHKPKYLDAVLFSLDRLLGIAQRYHVTLALENRYHYHQLPGPDDFPVIFNEFDGAPLGYWHDSGHAHVNDLLSVPKTGTLLNMNRDRLIGIHLHDAVGLNDHLPPGAGDIDFKNILADLPANVLKVIELKPGTPDADIEAGIDHITQHLNQLDSKNQQNDIKTDHSAAGGPTGTD